MFCIMNGTRRPRVDASATSLPFNVADDKDDIGVAFLLDVVNNNPVT
jgi:hypothetical protein